MVLGSTAGILERGVDWCKEKATRLRSDDEEGSRHLSVSPDRRRFLQRAGATAAVAGVGTSAATGSASAEYNWNGPEMNSCDLARTADDELPWDAGGAYGGWRATEHFGVSGGSVDDPPVIFVHGNGGDACNWEPIANYLLDNGWSGDELYAITFREETSSHPDMRDQLDEFVQHVLDETGAGEASFVAHSLGVTGTRFWAYDLDRYDWITNVAYLNGGNHGVCVCPGCYDTSLDGDFNGWLKNGEACQFIAVQCFADIDHPLYDLNAEETPHDASIDFFTVRGFFDPLFYCNPYSPYLAGADNNLIYRNHTGSLFDDSVKSWVDDWCSEAVEESESASDGDVEYWVDANLDGYGDTQMVVEVAEDASDKDLDVQLYDPSGNLEDDDTIYEWDLDDSEQRVELQMNGSDAVADAGEWDLVIDYDDGSGTFFSATVPLDEYDPLLTDDRYDVYVDEYGDYYLDRWMLELENNNGDAPLFVTEIQVTIDGETDYIYPDEPIEAGERDKFVCTDTETWFSDGTGTYDVDLELYVDDQLWATGTFDVEISNMELVDNYEDDDGLEDYNQDAHEGSPDASNPYFVDTGDEGGYDGDPHLGYEDLGSYSDAGDDHDFVHTYAADWNSEEPNTLPQPGDTISYYTQADYLEYYDDESDASQVRSWFYYGAQATDEKYGVEFSMPNADDHAGEVRLLKFDGSGDFAPDAVELDAVEPAVELDHRGRWYRVEIDWTDDGEHTVRVIDAEDDSNDVVATLDATDDSYGAGAIGFAKQGGPADGLYSLAYWDHVQVQR